MNSDTPLLSGQPAETSTAETSAPKTSSDLSVEIAQTVERRPGDRVRVMRVWGDNYRCNWIAPKNRLDVLETFIVRQSQFLNVTRAADGTLHIRVVGGEN